MALTQRSHKPRAAALLSNLVTSSVNISLCVSFQKGFLKHNSAIITTKKITDNLQMLLNIHSVFRFP